MQAERKWKLHAQVAVAAVVVGTGAGASGPFLRGLPAEHTVEAPLKQRWVGTPGPGPYKAHEIIWPRQ